ncbi:SusC/RagA family TonB-linked outer membrane protein [Maribellus mangrovi]|uniref:SusC/RagA family TonB-linked outer membrane protein n=1 Tax=Maribellus mangrovi TaxID=3133146 RepID=UPI0030ED3F4F
MKQTNQILIRKLCLVFVAIFMASAVWAQQTITGKVVDDAGEPLPGVAVSVQGKTIGTITDTDGAYTLEVSGNETLVFSFIGMQSVSEPINGRTTIDVTMKVDAIGLEEVVAVGYGVQKKATLTGAVGNVKSEELVQRPVANTTELLQGQVAGLYTRQTSGLPGEDGTTLNIRGYGTNPLVLVDGIESSLANVDPNDIESISVLKDASAAIYGARAGNGVILVTTKRGTEKPATITYHGNVSFTQPTFLPDLVGAKEWAELLHESGLNPDDYSPSHVHYDPDANRLINTMDNTDYKSYDWSDELYRDWTPQQQHNISATGGTKKIKYYVSAGFTDQESNFKAGDYDFNRYNVRSNIDAQITDDLQVTMDLTYRATKFYRTNVTADNMYNSLQTAKPVYPVIHEADPTRAATSGFLQRSPYYQMLADFNGYRDQKDNVIQGALQLKYNIPFVEGLVLKGRLNFEDGFTWRKTVSKPFDVWEYDPIAAQAGEDPWIKWGTQNSNNMSVYSYRSNEMLPQISLNYDKVIGDHNISAVLVGEAWTYKNTDLTGSRKDVLSFEAPFLKYASEEGKDNNENFNERARVSYIGRVNYDYAGKYMLEVSMRADASGEYPPEGRWGYFPSVSAGWRISEESFIKENFSAVNNLKLRGSYGILGNDAVSSFDYLTGYTISTNFYVFGTAPAPIIASAGLANPNITWETMKMSNIGLDGNFWDGLLGFEIDAFYRLRENILAQPTEQVPSTFGASLPRTNLNKRDNRGIEVALTHYNKIGDFSYDISPMIGWTRGKYVELDEDVLPETGDLDEETLEFNKLWNARYVNEGQWDDRQWGFVTDGFFMNQEQIDNHTIDQDQAGNQTIKVGDLIYKDLNGDDYIDWRDQKVIGKNGLPNTMYSLDMGAQWKGFSLRMLWQGGSGYIVSIGGSARAPFSNESIPIDYHYKYRAIVGQDADGMDYITNPDDFKLPPVTQNGTTANNNTANDFWNLDAAYLRLKNINLSYTLPKSLLDNIGIKNCVVYFSGSNVFSISNLGVYKHSFDPEITGANNRDYPPVKTATFGIRLTL